MRIPGCHSGFLTTLSIVALLSQGANGEWRREYQRAANLTLYTLNDNLNASWTVNTDDYRSFGLGGARTFRKPFELSMDYFGLTKRKGFPSGEGMRLDELSALLNYRFSYHSGFQRFTLTPGAGLFVAGDLSSQSLQNVVHRTMSLPEVEMGYVTKFLPTVILGSIADYGFYDTVFDGTEFSLTARARYAIRPRYDSRMEIGVFTALKGLSGDIFRLNFFNRYCRLYSSDPVLRYVSDAESGWMWQYAVVVGGFYISNEFGINNGFSTGSIGVSLTTPQKDHVFTREDFIFECGMLPGKSGWTAGIKAHPWEDGRFTLKADYVFLVPEDIEYPEFRLNQQELTFGGEFSLFPPKQQLTISPFVGAGGGIFRAMRYSGLVDTVVELHDSPVIAGEIGVWLGGRIPAGFLPANVLYGISVSDRFSVPVRPYKAKCVAGTISFIEAYNSIPVKAMVAVDY